MILRGSVDCHHINDLISIIKTCEDMSLWLPQQVDDEVLSSHLRQSLIMCYVPSAEVFINLQKQTVLNPSPFSDTGRVLKGKWISDLRRDKETECYEEDGLQNVTLIVLSAQRSFVCLTQCTTEPVGCDKREEVFKVQVMTAQQHFSFFSFYNRTSLGVRSIHLSRVLLG